MDITCDQYCDMGYIYLKPEYRDQHNSFKLNRKINTEENTTDMANIILKLNKLHWPKKLYKDALGRDFIEEFQNDLDENGYMQGIELKLPQDRLDRIVDNLKINKFEFNNKIYYFIPFDVENRIFSKNNYAFAFSEKEDAYVITAKTGDRQYMIDIRNNKSSISSKPIQIKALIFSEDSPYDIDYFKNLKIYKV